MLLEPVLGPVLSLVVVRVALGLYWLVHGLKMLEGQRHEESHLDKMMGGLKPRFSLGMQLRSMIGRNYSKFAVIIPGTMIVSGISLTFGIFTALGGLLSVLICLNILVMQPTGPGSVRSLLLLTTLGLVVSLSDASTALSIVPFGL